MSMTDPERGYDDEALATCHAEASMIGFPFHPRRRHPFSQARL